MPKITLKKFTGVVSDGAADEVPSTEAENMAIGKDGEYVGPRGGSALLQSVKVLSREAKPLVLAKDLAAIGKTTGVIVEVVEPDEDSGTNPRTWNTTVQHLGSYVPSGGARPVFQYDDSLDNLFLFYLESQLDTFAWHDPT